jgi:hypothetical protein
MKNLDTNQLFSIFSIGDEEIYKEHKITPPPPTPLDLFGKVLNALENYPLMDIIYLNRYEESYVSVRDSIKLNYFNNLISTLERIDLSHSDTVDMLRKGFDKYQTYLILTHTLSYYQDLEYYEKCAIILKFSKLFS